MVHPVLLVCLSYILSGEAWSQRCRACQPSSWFRQCRLCYSDYEDSILPLPDLDLGGDDLSEAGGKDFPLVYEKDLPEPGGKDLPLLDEKDLSEVDKKDIPVESEDNKKIVSERENSTNQEKDTNSSEDCDSLTDLNPCYPVEPIDIPSVIINRHPTHRPYPHHYPRQYTYYWTSPPRSQRRNADRTTENIMDITDDTAVNDTDVTTENN